MLYDDTLSVHYDDEMPLFHQNIKSISLQTYSYIVSIFVIIKENTALQFYFIFVRNSVVMLLINN